MSEEEEIENKIEPKKKRKIFRRIFLPLFIFWLIVEVILWFFATPLLRTTIKNYVESESGGLYSIDFDKISIEITSRTLKLENFKLTADTAIYRKLKEEGTAKTALYQISFNELKFTQLSIFNLFRNRELLLKTIEIEKPKMYLIGLPGKAKDNLPLRLDTYYICGQP